MRIHGRRDTQTLITFLLLNFFNFVYRNKVLETGREANVRRREEIYEPPRHLIPPLCVYLSNSTPLYKTRPPIIASASIISNIKQVKGAPGRQQFSKVLKSENKNCACAVPFTFCYYKLA